MKGTTKSLLELWFSFTHYKQKFYKSQFTNLSPSPSSLSAHLTTSANTSGRCQHNTAVLPFLYLYYGKLSGMKAMQILCRLQWFQVSVYTFIDREGTCSKLIDHLLGLFWNIDADPFACDCDNRTRGAGHTCPRVQELSRSKAQLKSTPSGLLSQIMYGAGFEKAAVIFGERWKIYPSRIPLQIPPHAHNPSQT